MLPKNWKILFENGGKIPKTMSFFNECTHKIILDRCSFQISEKKEFEAQLNPLKRQAINQFVFYAPYFKEEGDLIVKVYSMYTLYSIFLVYKLWPFFLIL